MVLYSTGRARRNAGDQVYRSYWAFERYASGLIRDWVSVYVHSAERPYFYRTPDELCFPLDYLFVHTVEEGNEIWQLDLTYLDLPKLGQSRAECHFSRGMSSSSSLRRDFA